MKKETMLRHPFLVTLSIALLLSVGSLFINLMPVAPAHAAADFPAAQFTAKIKGDAATVNQFAADLAEFLARATALQAAPKRSRAEVAALQTTANNLKSRAPQVKRLIQKVIDELKPGNHLGAGLDRFTEDKLKGSAAALAEVKAVGGATALLNLAVRECDLLPGEIDSITIKITEKAMNNTPAPVLIPASFSPAIVAFKIRDCLTSKIAITWCSWTDNTACREGAEKDLKKCQKALATQ